MRTIFYPFIGLLCGIHLFAQTDSLDADYTDLEGAVITGTLKEVSRLGSPIPVEVITSKLFRKNPTPSLFESVGMVNGVRPQLNCNVCNTGDIHINGGAIHDDFD